LVTCVNDHEVGERGFSFSWDDREASSALLFFVRTPVWELKKAFWLISLVACRKQLTSKRGGKKKERKKEILIEGEEILCCRSGVTDVIARCSKHLALSLAQHVHI
jgi:hypothetical protein